MPHDPAWLTAARAAGVVTERAVKQTALPGVEPSELGAMFCAVLPWGPSCNHHWRHVLMGRSVRVLLSAAGREYRKAVVRAVGQVKPLTGDLMLSMVMFPPDRRRLDCDNRIKPCLDALQIAGVYADDSQVREIRARFGPVDRSGGRVEVRIVPLAEADPL